MARVRNEAKNNVRRFIDDISFVVTKESRDRLQAIHRQLRNHYRGIANQTTRSLNESLQAMLTSARLEENERNQRVAELSRQLNILNQVSAKVAELAAPRPAATGPTPAQPRVTLRR
jgi:polyhydroxyalkanoate synthesis regulator phasin